MDKVYKKLILKFVSNKEYRPCNKTDLARNMGISHKDNPAFRKAFDELEKEDQIRVKRGIIDLPKISGTVIGVFRSTKKGFGFVVPRKLNSSGDLFIPAEETLDAMDGDTVIAKVRRRGGMRGGQSRVGGKVLEIVERSRTIFTGTLLKNKSLWFVEPDGKDLKAMVIIDDITAKNGRDGDKVSFDIIEYPSGNSPARGVITEILGRSGQYDAELEAIIRTYSLPGEFDDKCVDQAKKASQIFAEKISDESYDDITDQMLITIDPPDAKDFDDAISLRKTSDGSFILGVHIADVSRFIAMDSPLDIEAKERGNSVYLPGKVIPMLPEILSNGICSLQPNQLRYAKSAYITYDENGKVLGSEFANSLVKSKARLTYLQADAALKGNRGDLSDEVVSLLSDMEFLAKAIERRRSDEGMIHLDLHDTELIMDDDGKVVDAEPAEDCYPHTIIEMFMVEANVAVAQMLDRFKVPFIRRIHPDPDQFSMKGVSDFARISGLRVPRSMDRRSIQDLLKKVHATDLEFAVNRFVLRSFEKAEYSPLNMGHYALASRHYSHFTSPIRRYADLTAHRLVQCYLEGKLTKVGVDEVLPEGELVQIGRHISDCEIKATKAERELKKVLLLEMLSERIGDEMETVISGLTKFGVFVQCVKFGIEGLIPLHQLGNDDWQYEEKSQRITGHHSGVKITLGMPMRVRIVAVNVPGRHLDVAPLKPLANRYEKKKKSKKHNRRSSKKYRGKKNK